MFKAGIENGRSVWMGCLMWGLLWVRGYGVVGGNPFME